MDQSIKYGVVFSEVGSPIGDQQMLTCCSLIRLQKPPLILPASLLRFVLATGGSGAEIILDTQLLRDHNKYDQIPLSLFDQLQSVLPLADVVADQIVCEETNMLDEIIPQMFKVMEIVAEYSCDYVKRAHVGW